MIVDIVWRLTRHDRDDAIAGVETRGARGTAPHGLSASFSPKQKVNLAGDPMVDRSISPGRAPPHV